jgi:adenylate cyclase
VRDKLDLRFSDKGEIELKNIARPVQVFVIGGAKSPDATPALALPDKPSIAVLPFDNMSGDPEQVYFADGLAEDLITGLSRVSWLFCNRPQFLVCGSAARSWTFVQSANGSACATSWRAACAARPASPADGAASRGGDRQPPLGRQVRRGGGGRIRFPGPHRGEPVGTIEPKLLATETARAARKRPDRLDAFDLYLRALAKLASYSPKVSTKRSSCWTVPSVSPLAMRRRWPTPHFAVHCDLSKVIAPMKDRDFLEATEFDATCA